MLIVLILAGMLNADPVLASVTGDKPDASAQRFSIRVQKDFAGQFHVAPDDIEIVATVPRVWRDDCMAIAGPGDVCTRKKTRGYSIFFRARGKAPIYEVRANNATSELRFTGALPQCASPARHKIPPACW